jgi:nucleolar protein 15
MATIQRKNNKSKSKSRAVVLSKSNVPPSSTTTTTTPKTTTTTAVTITAAVTTTRPSSVTPTKQQRKKNRSLHDNNDGDDEPKVKEDPPLTMMDRDDEDDEDEDAEDTEEEDEKTPASALNRSKTTTTTSAQKKNKEIDTAAAAAVIYIGHLPNLLGESELLKLLKQFGGNITHVRVSRSETTGRTRGYAFVRLREMEIAQIIVSTLSGYLLFSATKQPSLHRRLVCHIVPPEQVHPRLFVRRTSAIKAAALRKQRKQAEPPKKALETLPKVTAKLIQMERTKRKKIHNSGIDYIDFPGYEKVSTSTSSSSELATTVTTSGVLASSTVKIDEQIALPAKKKQKKTDALLSLSSPTKVDEQIASSAKKQKKKEASLTLSPPPPLVASTSKQPKQQQQQQQQPPLKMDRTEPVPVVDIPIGTDKNQAIPKTTTSKSSIKLEKKRLSLNISGNSNASKSSAVTTSPISSSSNTTPGKKNKKKSKRHSN